MDQKAGAQISQKAFVQSVVILFVLMIAAGVMTLIIPSGRYARVMSDGREVIQPGSFQLTPRPDYPIWRWFTAPLEVLGGDDGATVIVIIVFLLMVGVAFALLDKSALLTAALARLVRALGGRKYILLLVISFFFMLLGAFFGIFEEVVPLVPLMIALAYVLGWDSLTGLGMSIFATNLGFSAAISNPFTIGVAQKLAGLPLFSGAPLRVVIFLVVYLVFAVFITRYAKKVEREPRKSAVYEEDQAAREKYSGLNLEASEHHSEHVGQALTVLVITVVLILGVLFASPFVSILSSLSLPLVGLLFFIGGAVATWIGGIRGKEMLRAALDGLVGIAPAIPLILMAASIKYIVAQGGIIDTILNSMATAFNQASPLAAAGLVYALALVIEFFVSSGSAKAFLLMPILLPLADLVGVTRQTTVLAYCFGDGFSNLAYPTNPVLLICLGLSSVSYGKWLRWTLPFWGIIIVITLAFLGIAVATKFGPF